MGRSQAAAVWGSGERADSPALVTACRKCGAVDSTLRVSAFAYVLSAVVITLRRAGSSGIFCSSCRRKEGIKYSLLTAVVGWWGFPWGPVFSVQSIFRNSKGGIQSKEANATLLAAAGRTLADRGETSEAIRALEESANLHSDAEVSALLAQIRGYTLVD